jgi:hypothetical protein
MNRQKKIKVIDTVFFTDEIDYLLFRLTELNDYVDMFIILEPLVDYSGLSRISVFETHIEKFEFCKNKIIHIKSTSPSDEDIKEIIFYYKLEKLETIEDSKDKLYIKQLHDLKVSLDSFDLSFDDVIMLSNIDEIPVVPPIDILKNHLSFGPLLFSQKDFIWSKDFCKLENHLGTLCFSYSHLVTSNMMFNLQLSKNDNDKAKITPINFGYRFSYFNSIQESVKKISEKYNQDDLESIEKVINDSRNNLMYYDLSSQSNPKPLKKYFGDLPKNIDMLNSQPIGRTNPKKHFVVINNDELYCNENVFDSISIIKSSNNISSKNLANISDKITTHFIVLPKEKYYDILIKENDLKNFQEMYFLNEIKKILVLQFPLDIDIFVFNYNGISLTYSWSEIKNNFIYDLLNK